MRFWSVWVGSISLGIVGGLWPSVAEASQGKERVRAIYVRGQQRVERAAIRRCIRTRIGRPMELAKIRKDVRRIYALGRFRDVDVEQVPMSRGVALIYRVKERPMIRKVKLMGYKHISRDDIKKVMDVQPHGILDRVKIRQNVEKILDHYRSQGYHFATVKADISKPTGAKAASVDITFQIKERAQMRIRKIDFVGNRQIKSGELRSVLYSQEFHLLSWINGRSLYRRDMASRDVYLLQAHYMDRGFIQARIKAPVIQVSRDGKSISMTFKIREGPRYRYGNIDVKGDLLWSRKRLLRALSIRRGQIFHRARLYQRNLLKLQNMYQDRGYARVNVIPRHRLRRRSRRLDMTIHIEKGPKIWIERIEIVGNTRTRDRVIRRQIQLREGDLYSGSKVQRSQRRIYALGYFAKTHPRYGVKVVSKPGSSPARMILRFVVKEKPSGNFRIGVGYGGLNGFSVTAQVAQNNFMGWGKAMSLGVQLSLAAQQVQMSYRDPNLFGTDLSLGVSFYHLMNQISPFPDIQFGEMRTGGTLTLGYPIIDRLRAFVSYKAERIGRNPLVGDVDETTLLSRTLFGGDGATFTSSLTFGLELDLRNNRIFPTSGTYHRASIEVADGFLGSQNRFYRFSMVNRAYVELPLGMVFKVNAELGVTASPTDQEVPYLMRYRLGGARTIRGFGELSIGPQKTIATGALDTTTLNWGGNKQLLINVELEVPIIPKLGIRAVAFFDAGNVYAENEMFFQDLRNPGLPLGLLMSAGFGVRWRSPMGDLRFEFGFPLVRRADDPTWRFHFQIGGSF